VQSSPSGFSQITETLLGISQMSFSGIQSGQKSKLFNYLSPKNHTFSADKGRIRLESKEDFLGIDARGLVFRYFVPSRKNLPAVKATGFLNGKIALEGNNETGKYTSTKLSGTFNSYVFSSDSDLRISPRFRINDLDVDINLEGRVSVPSSRRFDANLTNISAKYSTDNASVNLTTKGTFKLSNKSASIDVDQVSINYRNGAENWNADISISALGEFTAAFSEDGVLMGRVASDSSSNLDVEVSPDLLTRFDISDESINNLLQGRTLRLGGFKASNFETALMKSDSDLTPLLSLMADGKPQTYNVENVISDFFGLNSVDLRLLKQSDGGGGSGSSGTGGGGSNPSNGPTTEPPNPQPNPGPSSGSSLGPGRAAPPPSQASPPVSAITGVTGNDSIRKVDLENPLDLGKFTVRKAIIGTTKNDRIVGSNKSEILSGLKGKDNLTGGGGADAFVFEIPGEFGAKKKDIIVDFKPAKGDIILIAREILEEKPGKLSFVSADNKSQLRRVSKAGKMFVYHEKTGLLYYDANGKKPGWGEGGEFAKLLGAPEISRNDFVLM
jgi:hypothetical protein